VTPLGRLCKTVKFADISAGCAICGAYSVKHVYYEMWMLGETA
jgi:hypothetical protein